MGNKLVSIYQAAALLGISPTLLKYFTERAVKTDDSRKLAAKKGRGENLYFEVAELRSYDAWLKAPWPSTDDKRPHLPKAIREEIRIEANLECALCNKSGEAGEAAHIDPLKTSKCNHPHNLIWLCANHHTKFDNGCFGPKGSDNKTIVALKVALQHFKRTSWQGMAEVSSQIAATLSLCEEMQRQLERVSTPVEIEAVERLGKRALALLPELASQSKVGEVSPILDRLTKELESEKSKKSSTKKQLRAVISFEEEFLRKSGLVRCPLCRGLNSNYLYDCPICSGDGSVEADREVDLTPFDSIDCDLCVGTGRYDYEDCPACGGNGEMERRFYENYDFCQFDLVSCSLCLGKCKWHGDECPVCRGEGEIQHRVAEKVDVGSYNYVDCPICEGTGRFAYEECPECNGERTIPNGRAREIDISEYEEVRCPACKGKRELHGSDCPACGGEGRMLAKHAEQLDLSLYTLVKCPECNGKRKRHGEDCRACNGEGELLKYYRDRYY